MAPATSEKSARDALTERVLPRMTLSTGDESSLTGPPPPPPHYLNAEGRARFRFEVEGNAMWVTSLLRRLERANRETE